MYNLYVYIYIYIVSGKMLLDPKGKKRVHGVSQKVCKIISKSQTRPQTTRSRKVDCACHEF